MITVLFGARDLSMIMCEVVDNVKLFDLSERGMLLIGSWLHKMRLRHQLSSMMNVKKIVLRKCNFHNIEVSTDIYQIHCQYD